MLESVDAFHSRRLEKLLCLSLSQLLRRQNWHLLRARNHQVVGDLIREVLENRIASADARLFRKTLDDIVVKCLSLRLPVSGRQGRERSLNFKYGRSSYTVSLLPKSGSLSTRDARRTGYKPIPGHPGWYAVPLAESLYVDVIEPTATPGRQHDERFSSEKIRILNVLTQRFTEGFCTDGRIDWKRLVEFNSGMRQKTVKKRSDPKTKARN